MRSEVAGRCRCAVALGVGAVLVFLLHEPGNTLIQVGHLARLLFWVPPVVLVEWLRRRGLDETGPGAEPGRHRWALVGLLGALLLLLSSSVIQHAWFFFLRWGEPTPARWFRTPSWLFILTALWLLPLTLRWPRADAVLLRWVLGFCMAAGAVAVWRVTGGVFLIRDDHPSFVFRLWQVRSTWPALMSYNPWWNGGGADMHPLTSGTLAPWLLLWPLWRFFPVEQVYTPGFVLLFLGLVPALGVLSVRAVRGGATAQAAAGLLALGVGQQYYLWLLHFGTIGACITAALLMPASALLYRLVVMRRTDAWTCAGTIAVFALILFYPPGILTVAPLGLCFLLQWRRWNRRVWRALLLCAAAVTVIHARTLWALLSQIDFSNSLDRSRPAMIPTASLRFWSWAAVMDGLRHLRGHLRQAHPALVMFGLLGLLFTPHRRWRLWCLPHAAGLAWLCGWGRFVAPHLQLTRMVIPMLFAVVVPAALHVADVLRIRGMRWGMARAALLSILVMSALNNVLVLSNRGLTRYGAQSDDHREMTEWLSAETQPDMRVLFAGRTVHAYGGGHVAVLPVLTGLEMMAADYYHFDPREVEYEFPPRPYRASIEGMREFMDIYNVGAVLTVHANYIGFFERHPELFEPAGRWAENPVIRAFRVRRDSNGRVWQGTGRATAGFNRIRVTADPEQEELILGYNWAPRLTVDPPAELFRHDTGEWPVLIGVRPNGLGEFEIRYLAR